MIFIDDLDRCTPETVNGMLELTNYLADVGRCFVVIGAAMDRVQRCVRSPETTVYDEEYAIAYLRKLVHIELPVPRHRELLNQFANAAPTGFAGPPAPSKAPRRTGIGLVVVGGLAVLLLVFMGGQRLHKGSVGTALQVIEVVPPAVEPGASVPVVGLGREPVFKPVQPVRRTAVGLVATAPSAWSAGWIGVAGLIAVAGVAGVAGFLWRWVRRHRERLVVALGGALRTKDSNHFMEALQIWNPVVVSYDPTPRHVKRFYNRARLFAAYEHEDASVTAPTDDECLVALAAMHHLDPSSLGSLATFLPRGADAVTGLKAWLDAAERAANSAPDESAAGDQRQRHRQQALQTAWELHLKAFASAPSAQQVRRFASRVEGILVR